MTKFPVTFFSSIIGQFTFPLFSKYQDNRIRLKEYFKGGIVLTSLVLYPVLTGIFIVAQDLILVLLSDKWLEALPYIKYLVFVGMFTPLSVINLNIINSRGRSDQFLKADLISKLLIVLGLAISYRYGVEQMALGYVFAMASSYVVYTYYTKLHLGISVLDQLIFTSRGVSMSFIMGVVVWYLQNNYLLDLTPLIRLTLSTLIGIGFYALMLRVFSWKLFWTSFHLYSRES